MEDPEPIESARLRKDRDGWVLVIERYFPVPVARIWAALTQRKQITRWGPYDPARDLVTTGPVRLAHIAMPDAPERNGEVFEVEPPRLLVMRWGDDMLRWEIEETNAGSRLVLRHQLRNRADAPRYGAGWHLCLSGLGGLLAGRDMPSMVGQNAESHGYDALRVRYGEHFGTELPGEAP